jgi:hypothetical protein
LPPAPLTVAEGELVIDRAGRAVTRWTFSDNLDERV